MLTIGFFILLLQGEAKAPAQTTNHSQVADVEQIADSGRCAAVGESPDSRVAPPAAIAPGPPPLLSFRYYQGKLHHRYGNADLMLDDAGH
jgi:hypothetical protein